MIPIAHYIQRSTNQTCTKLAIESVKTSTRLVSISFVFTSHWLLVFVSTFHAIIYFYANKVSHIRSCITIRSGQQLLPANFGLQLYSISIKSGWRTPGSDCKPCNFSPITASWIPAMSTAVNVRRQLHDYVCNLDCITNYLYHSR